MVPKLSFVWVGVSAVFCLGCFLSCLSLAVVPGGVGAVSVIGGDVVVHGGVVAVIYHDVVLLLSLLCLNGQ